MFVVQSICGDFGIYIVCVGGYVVDDCGYFVGVLGFWQEFGYFGGEGVVQYVGLCVLGDDDVLGCDCLVQFFGYLYIVQFWYFEVEQVYVWMQLQCFGYCLFVVCVFCDDFDVWFQVQQCCECGMDYGFVVGQQYVDYCFFLVLVGMVIMIMNLFVFCCILSVLCVFLMC